MSVGPRRWVVVLTANPDVLSDVDTDLLAAKLTAASGMSAQVLGSGGADYALPYEEFPEPQYRDAPLLPLNYVGRKLPEKRKNVPIATHASIGGAFVELASVGFMPALYVNLTGPQLATEAVLVGDERMLQAHATLVRNAVASAVSSTASRRRSAGQGRIPRLWEPGR